MQSIRNMSGNFRTLLLGLTIFGFAMPAFAQQSPLIRGLSAFRDGDYNRASQDLKRAYSQNPQSGEALYYLGPTYYQLGQHADALQTFREAERKSPKLKDQLSAYYRALAYYKLKLYCQARKSFTDSAAFDPQTKLASSSKRYITMIGESLDNKVTAPTLEIFYGIGLEALAAKKYWLSLEYFEEVECLALHVKNPPRKLLAENEFYLAEAALGAGDYAAVIRRCKADDTLDKNPNMRLQLARALMKQGKAAEAGAELQEMLRRAPKGKWADQARQLLQATAGAKK